jgi:WD40 repeat protein
MYAYDGQRIDLYHVARYARAQITYWDSSDCNAIRIMDGSSEEVRSLAIEPDGKFFVSGSNDKLVKLWDYDEGTLRAVGTLHLAVCVRCMCSISIRLLFPGAGHSGAVQVVQISPDQSRIVSVGAEGAIFFWTSPPELSRDLRAGGYAPKVRCDCASPGAV